MKFRYKENNYRQYRDIMRGEFFLYEGTLYLKISTSDTIPNAFNCETNELTNFYGMTFVRPINMIIQEV